MIAQRLHLVRGQIQNGGGLAVLPSPQSALQVQLAPSLGGSHEAPTTDEVERPALARGGLQALVIHAPGHALAHVPTSS